MSVEELSSNDLISSLWSNSSIDKCRLGLSDALIYEAGLPVRWYVTGNAGEIKLKRNVDLPTISRRWTSISEQSDSSYVAAIRQEGLVKFLTVTAWEAFAADSKVANPDLLSLHAFIGRGTNPIIYRNYYQMNISNGRWRTKTQSYSIPKEDIMHISYNEKLQLVDSRASEIAKVLDLATTTVVRFVEKMLKIQITECSIDYVIDKKSQVWMLWTNKTAFVRPDQIRPSSPKSPGQNMETTSQSLASTSNDLNENEGLGKAMSQQIQEMAKQIRKDPNADKLNAINTLNTFTAKEVSSSTTAYPTPFKCQGDYCHLAVNPTGPLAVDKAAGTLHLTKKLFTEKELEVLKKDASFSKFTQSNTSTSEGLLQMNMRSVELATKERRGLAQISAVAAWEDGVTNDQAAAPPKQSNKRYMSKTTGNVTAIEGFPENMNTYYDQVHVCPTCYDAYRCLDWARDILTATTNKIKKESLARPSSSTSSPPRSLAQELSSSMPSLTLCDTLPPDSRDQTNGRIGKRKTKPSKAKTWKGQMSAAEEEVGNKQDSKFDIKTLENYVRGKSQNNSSSYISRDKSKSPPKKGKQKEGSNQLDESTLSYQTEEKKKKVKSTVYHGRILIASADMQQANEARRILEGALFKVNLVIDGREALNEVITNWKDYDVAVFDRDQLPLVDIFHACKEIRVHEKSLRKSYSLQNQKKNALDSEKFLHFHIPFICFSTAYSQADLNQYMKADMDGFISKPVESEALITTMRAAIPQHLAPITNNNLAEDSMASKNAKVTKFGLLGELEGSQDSASMALKTLPIMGSNEGAENQGLIQLDADTKVPYLVLNGSKYSRIRQNSTREKYFNLVVCHDIFDTFERMKILLQPIVSRYQAIQVLVWNYPGQAMTEWRSTQTLNNEYLAACLNEVLGQVGEHGTKDFATQEPFYILGYGYGANIAAYYLSHYRAPNVRGLILANGWAFVDSYLAGVMHDCVNIFQSSPASRPDLPVYFFSRFLFAKDYLAKVSVPLALNIYTAVYNSITITGRIQLCQGLMKSVDIRPLLRSIDYPIISIHSDQNSFVRPVHVEPFVSSRGGEVRSIYHALQDFRRTCVVWIHGGHEIFQENRKQVVLLLEQILTGYHEVHELTFPSASSIVSQTNAMASMSESNLQDQSLEDKFTQSVLSISKKHMPNNNSSENLRTLQQNSAANSAPSSPGKSSVTFAPSQSSPTQNSESNKPSTHQTSNHNSSMQQSWNSFSDNLLQKQHSILTYDSKAQNTNTNGNTNLPTVSNLNHVPMNDVHKYPEVKEYMQWRLKRNKKRLQRLQLAAQSIQCAFRAYLARKLVKTIRELRAAIEIQRVFRGHLGRKKFFQRVKMLWAAINIQKVYRGFVSRKYYFEMQVRIAAAADIQRMFRGYKARERVKKIKAQRNAAACIIQAMFRRFQARRDAWLKRLFRNAATIIQRNFRGLLGRKRASAERDKYIFSKSQSQGIEFGRQMLLEHKLHVTKLQSDVTLLSQEKVSAEEQIEALLEEISSFEEGVRVLEKEMHQLSKVESEAAAFMDEDSKFELREQKMRLDREFGEMLGKIANRKDMLNDIEKKLAAIDKARQGKEEELRTLERKLVVLLEDQQKELSMIKRKQDVRGALLAASHNEIQKITGSPGTAGGSGGSVASAVNVGAGGGGGGFSGPSLQEKRQAAQLMQSTETLMKFGFMSMSMTYFSSLNMIKALRTVSAQDTVMAALADVHAQRAVGHGGPGGGDSSVGSVGGGGGGMLSSTDRVMARLKKGELPGQQRLQVSSWSVEDVSKWLQSLSLGQYSEAFIDAAVDGEFLYDLNDDDLKNTLGIEHRLHRKKILHCIQRLKMAEVQSESRLGKLQHTLFNGGVEAGAAAASDGAAGAPDMNSIPNFNNVSFPDASGPAGGEDDARIMEGPRVPLTELFSYVRHSKFAQLKEAIDYLPNKSFDKSLVQAPYVEDFGTVYSGGYERLVFHMNKVDEYGNTLLIYACQNGNSKIAKYLILKGANANHQNKQGQTAAHFCIAYHFFDLSTWLFENGADDTVENKYGLTPYDGLNNEGDGEGGNVLAIGNE